jgi:hypothetical protein
MLVAIVIIIITITTITITTTTIIRHDQQPGVAPSQARLPHDPAHPAAAYIREVYQPVVARVMAAWEQEEEQEEEEGHACAEHGEEEEEEEEEDMEVCDEDGGPAEGDGEEAGAFSPVEGTALFTLICSMNHSCAPNCVTKYAGGRGGPMFAEVVALRDLADGEELLHGYIDTGASYEERQRLLEDYGFRCTCEKCVQESSSSC